MNRVRIVAVTAVALGAAVVAGTRLQETHTISEAPAVAQATSATVAAPSLAQLAEAPGAAPVAPVAAGLQTASVAGLLPAAEGVQATNPQTASARLEPGLPPADASLQPATALPPGAQAALDPDPATPVQPIDPQLQAELDSCAVWLVATPTTDSMLEASIYAPCDNGASIVLSHAGLRIDEQIGADGQLMVLLPALVEDASVTVTFGDGREQSDTTFVPGLADMERVALQWQGAATLSLHAYEFGAAYGEPGHVHQGSERSDASRGFVTALGDPMLGTGNQVQVYSFPRGQSARSGQVTLEVEIPVTEASCGKPLAVQAIEVHGSSSVQVRQISLEMPVCDGNGGYVVLPGVLPDLQIAMN